jgi:hypothetical protein
MPSPPIDQKLSPDWAATSHSRSLRIAKETSRDRFIVDRANEALRRSRRLLNETAGAVDGYKPTLTR